MSENFEKFGKYILLDKVATGGMAEVYLAKSIGHGGVAKYFALKRILPQFSDNPEFIDMFKEEAKIAVNLNHNNVVKIIDFGVVRGQFHLVMEYVEGRNLRQVLNHMKKSNLSFSTDQVIFIIREIAAGLDHAHRCLDATTGRPLNITHRDMSPQNVMMSFEGEVKIVDFGIAKAETQLESTRAGTLKGKFGYMSPEQAEGQSVDLRTDIFSLGIIFWELLANDRLFVSNNEINTLRKVRECQIPALRKINPNIPAELERICNKALTRDRNLRYQTSGALQRDLNRFLNTNYPEFSVQDFSVFMKSLYSDVIIQNRSKFVEYGKVQVSHVVEKTEVTHTETQTSSKSSKPPPAPKPQEAPSNFLKVEAPQKPNIDFASLKSKGPVNSRYDDGFTVSNARMGHTMKTHVTMTAVRAKKKSFSDRVTGMLFSVLLLGFLSGAVYFLFFGNKVDGRKAGQGSDLARTATNATAAVAQPSVDRVDLASQQKGLVTVTVYSTPDSAQIYLNGISTSFTTPGRITIEPNKLTHLTLKKDGYLNYEYPLKTGQSTSLNLTLSGVRMGFLDIAVSNGGSSPIIYIDGKRLGERPPITKYPVASGTRVKIRAENPFAQLYDEMDVVVGADQKQQVHLTPNKGIRKP